MSIARPVNQPVTEKAYRSNETVTGSGTVGSGFFVCGFLNTGSAAATVDGESIPAGTSVTLPFVGKPYAEQVAYDATGTTLLIKVIW